ncbi:MAG: hypothetical protein Q4D41_08195 [Prevotellaceae bacterium]|nr:hypothetical protein [Prevotellaceae bacterium]
MTEEEKKGIQRDIQDVLSALIPKNATMHFYDNSSVFRVGGNVYYSNQTYNYRNVNDKRRSDRPERKNYRPKKKRRPKNNNAYNFIEAEEVIEDTHVKALPCKLSTPEAKAMLDKLRAARLLDDNYMPTSRVSLAQKGIIASSLADRLGIRDLWKTFGDHWGVKKETLRSAFNNTINASLDSDYNNFKDRIKRLLKD